MWWFNRKVGSSRYMANRIKKSMKKRMRSLLFLIVLISIGILNAQDQGLSPIDLSKMKYVSTAEISSDGAAVAYTVVQQGNPMKENVVTSQQLWVYDIATKTSTPFITQGDVTKVAFRPNHSTITFLSKRAGDKTTCLYEIPMAGGEALKIVEHETSISSYEWSPDGQTIVCQAKEKDDVKSVLPYEPIVYEENLLLTKAYLIRPGQVAELIPLEGRSYVTHWSPDGAMLSISTAPSALVDDSYMKQTINIIDVASMKVTARVEHAAKLGTFVWSPDSKHLGVIAGADIHDPIAGRLFVISTDGGAPKNIIPDYKGKFESIKWANSKTIQFIASDGSYSTFGTISSNGKSIQKKIEKGSVAFSSFSRANNGIIALVGSSANHPKELFILKEKQLERATNSNIWLKDRHLGSQEVISYKAKDGLELEGIVILPVDYQKGRRYPLITVVHGGPESHYDQGWITGYSTPGHMAAANGYVVFYPNYRGSTGRGLEFAKTSQGDPAGLEFDDIIDGIDYLIEEGIVDRSKVGVTGGSYGGYATAWMSTRHTERFAAGVMSVGISNNLSFWGTSDIPEEMYLVHSRSRIWDDYEFALKRSPIYYAGQSKTPLLIMTGADDTRVDPGQSKELYRHIKTRTDTPVRLVLYPGEGHGNKKSTARLDYSLRMMRWFNRYLKQDGGDIPEKELELE